MSRNIHRWARLHRLNHGTELRDVLLNSWEGVYFKVNQEGAWDPDDGRPGELGGELFVMDDGWDFGDRLPAQQRQEQASETGRSAARKLPPGGHPGD